MQHQQVGSRIRHTHRCSTFILSFCHTFVLSLCGSPIPPIQELCNSYFIPLIQLLSSGAVFPSGSEARAAVCHSEVRLLLKIAERFVTPTSETMHMWLWVCGGFSVCAHAQHCWVQVVWNSVWTLITTKVVLLIFDFKGVYLGLQLSTS